MRSTLAVLLFLSLAVFPDPSRSQDGIPFIGLSRVTVPPTAGARFGLYPLFGLGPFMALPPSPASLSGNPGPYQERELLPIFDDAGKTIYRYQIASGMDRGLGGLLIGSLIGIAMGFFVSEVAFSSKMECGRDWKGDRCSPQETSLRHRVPNWGALVGGVGVGYLGFRIDRTTWEEALEAIRARRRIEASRGGGR